MAFVFQSQRLLHSYNRSTKNVGPGSYKTIELIKKPKHQSAIAPFNSTSIKRSIYDRKNLIDSVSSPEKVGPGYYDPTSYDFYNNNVKTYVNNKSVIVKFQSMGSNQFKSTVPRFKSQSSIVPGPGEYEKDVRESSFMQQIKKMSLQKRRALKQKANEFLKNLKKQKKIQYKPSIPSKSFKLQKNPTNMTQAYSQNRKKVLSEQAHNRTKSQSSQKVPAKNKAFTWFKAQRKSIIQNVKNNALQRHLGPGKYYHPEHQISQNQKLQNILSSSTVKNKAKNYKPPHSLSKTRSKSQSHTFKSKAVRSFFDQIYYQTNLQEVANKRQNQHYLPNNSMLGPGYYNVQMNHLNDKVKSSKYNTAYQFFGSTVERFQEPDDLNFNPYQPVALGENSKKGFSRNEYKDCIGQDKSFNKSKHGFLSDVQRKVTCISTQNSQIPGPGDYDNSKNMKMVFKPKKGKIVQNFGFSRQRFQTQISKKQQSPQKDPFNIRLKTLQEQQFFRLRKKVPQQSFMFKSKIKKEAFLADAKSQNDDLFGKYDVSNTDMSTKLMKKSIFLQNLKKIQVQVPAFNSNKPRFQYQSLSPKSKPTQQSLYHQQLKSSLNSSITPSQTKQKFFINSKSQSLRQKVIQRNKQQVQVSKKSTIYNKEDNKDRFQYVERKNILQNPGVGDYSLRSKWTKQTYNIKYHTNAIKHEAMRMRDQEKSSNKLGSNIQVVNK